MKSKLILGAAMLALTPSLYAQRPVVEARREQLQEAIVDRFVTHAATQLGLDANGRGKLEQHLRESGKERRELARRSAQLRHRMIETVRDSASTDTDFRSLLQEAGALRQKEDELWRQEQEALSRFLTPRQQVQFVFMWLRFNDQIREMALRPHGPPRSPRR